MSSNKQGEDLPDVELEGTIAIVAGNGQLPVAVAQTLKDRGQMPFLLLLRGEAASGLYAYPHEEISIVEFSRLVHALKRVGARTVVLAGGVKRRPLWRDLQFDIPTLRILPRLLFALRRGDDALLRAFIGALESYEFQVLGAHQIVPELLAPGNGRLTKCRPKLAAQRDMELAARAATMLGTLDVGQGAVAVRGRIVALEGAEGTDEMLARVQDLRASGRIPRQGGVLVKVMKPEQETRVDLPTIGPVTIEIAHRARLDGIAVEAGRSFILEPAKTIARADKYAMFIEVITLKS